jgi:hypothetical protein
MKRLLFVVALAGLANASAFAQEVETNGGMPVDSPPAIEVANIPMGSGVPSVGQSTGYTEATPVADGLYHVPGYMPYQSTAETIWPRVVNVRCTNKEGEWYCTGYHVDGVLERGEDIYVRPQFINVVASVPAAKVSIQPQPVAATPVPHVHHLLLKKKPVCN